MKLDKPVFADRPELVDNVYFAKILGIDLKVWTEDNKSLNWKFELVQPPYIGKRVWVWGSTGTAPTPKARLTAFGAALGYSREQLSDSSFDTDSLIGSYVKVLYSTTTKDDGSTKQSVTQLLPLTEADQQLLQMWLSQAQVTGTAKVAVAATPVPSVQLTQNTAPVISAPVVSQPTVPNPVGSPSLATTHRRTGPIPF